MNGTDVAEGAAGDDQHAGQQLLGRERDRHDVVDALLEGGQLGLQIPAPRQRQDRGPRPAAVARAGHLLQEPVAADVHVDDGQVGVPVSEHRGCLGDVLRLARDVDAVVERELDHLDDQRLLDHHQDARRVVHGDVRFRHGDHLRAQAAAAWPSSWDGGCTIRAPVATLPVV